VRGAGLRIWSAGCGRGEEAYSAAIAAKEAQEDRGGRGRAEPFVLGTDVNGHVLEHARAGVYGPEALAEVTKETLDRYFTEVSGRYRPTR